ncbi:hypothetical protein HPB52_018947 [Rhipicephalus sanguineus]|uniref:CCHC-type domain-containing protein n=1 Tax=Rhipicephalus sanguineus TaxID=34632 RepID=A0A9D4SUW6_RHISA|nr:hypothetical protein HPB52_018947 [Rhipicephalus sanguineus]
MNCTAPFCGRCGTYGHDGKGCSLPCRRSGDPHATVACTIRRSYSEAASKDFPPLQPLTPASDKRKVPPAPTPGPAQDQNTQDAAPHPTPAASPVSPDPASASTANDPVRRRQRDVRRQSRGLLIVREESPSTDDGTVHIEDSGGSSSETPLQIDEDATPSDVNRESVNVLVPLSIRSSNIKRHRVSSSDSETRSRDRSPLRTPTRPRKPRASGVSPGRKK